VILLLSVNEEARLKCCVDEEKIIKADNEFGLANSIFCSYNTNKHSGFGNSSDNSQFHY